MKSSFTPENALHYFATFISATLFRNNVHLMESSFQNTNLHLFINNKIWQQESIQSWPFSDVMSSSLSTSAMNTTAQLSRILCGLKKTWSLFGRSVIVISLASNGSPSIENHDNYEEWRKY